MTTNSGKTNRVTVITEIITTTYVLHSGKCSVQVPNVKDGYKPDRITCEPDSHVLINSKVLKGRTLDELHDSWRCEFR